MKTENVYCDYCHKKTTDEGIKKERLHGFIVEIGFSIDGWGARKDIIRKNSVEICDVCFGLVKVKSMELAILISDLQKRNKSNVI